MHEITLNVASGEMSRFLALANGKPPIWANLGQIVTSAQTAAEALKLAHLDFTLADAPLYTQWSKAGLLQVPTHKAIVRLDTKESVGIVGKDFSVYQPVQAFDFTNALRETNEANYISAGLLRNGSQMFILMGVTDACFSIGEDKHETYLLFCTGFDGSMRRTTKLVTTRVECANTMAMALGQTGTTFAIKNTKNANTRMESVKAMLQGVKQNAQGLKTKLEKLANVKLNRETYKAILDRVFPVNEETEKQTRRNNILSTVTELFESNDKNAFPEQRGTAYNLLNAITNYADHERASRANGHTAEYKRSESALFGSGEQLKQEAFDVILRMTDGSEVIETRYRDVPKTGEDILSDILA